MKRIGYAVLAVAFLLMAAPAEAVTVANGVVLFNQADAVAGNVTPGDAPGFPVTLSAIGSYRLAGNLSPPAGANGIDVTAPEVTIDMFGFRLAGSGAALNGIIGNQRALTVINGTIRGFADTGIVMKAIQLNVDKMRISNNGGQGVAEGYNVAGTFGYARVTNSTITENGGNGISCTDKCYVEGNTIANN